MINSAAGDCYDPIAEVYYDYPTGSNTVPTPVASGTANGSAVYGQPFDRGPADITQAGGLSPFGTMAQGGNVWELEETSTDGEKWNFPIGTTRRMTGGSWNSTYFSLHVYGGGGANPDFSTPYLGFRIAAAAPIPEPTSLALFSLATVMLGTGRYRTRRS